MLKLILKTSFALWFTGSRHLTKEQNCWPYFINMYVILLYGAMQVSNRSCLGSNSSRFSWSFVISVMRGFFDIIFWSNLIDWLYLMTLLLSTMHHCYDSIFYLILSNFIVVDTCWHFYYLCSYRIVTTCPQPSYKAQHYYCEVTKQLVRRSSAQYAVDTCK